MSGISLSMRKCSASNSVRRPVGAARTAALCIGALAGLLIALPAAVADDVKVGNLWITDVAIREVRNGQLVFRSGGGWQRQPLSKIQAIRIDAHPELSEGRAHLDASRYAEAARSYQQVARDARADWLRAYARARIVEAAAGARDARLAAETFTQLAATAPDDALVPAPPVQAVRAAGEEVKAEIERMLQRSLADVPRERRGAVRSLIEALAQSPADTGGDGEEAGGDGDGAEPAVVLPTVLKAEDEVNQLLLAGEFERAESRARERLNSPGGTSRELYQLGQALLGQAEQTGEPADYKTAALPFMRIVIHFRGGSRVDDYARVEAAYCHLRFGRGDIASRMLNEARNGITEEDDPAYARRIDTLIREMREAGK